MVEDDVNLVNEKVALETASGVPHHFAHGILQQSY